MSRRGKRRETHLLIDTGALLASIDKGDQAHESTVKTLRRMSKGLLLTTWPCVTEAMYLLWKTGGHALQDALWLWLSSGVLQLHDLTTAEQQRMRALMAQYADTPMDLADASLVVVAESLDLHRVFTLDDDFYIYRLADGSTLEIVR